MKRWKKPLIAIGFIIVIMVVSASIYITNSGVEIGNGATSVTQIVPTTPSP